MIEHSFHCKLKPIGLVIKIEVANENLPSKNAQYRHVLTILQKQSSISQIVEMPKLTRIQKSSKVNLLSHVSWPMALVIRITIEEIVHHRSLQVFDEKMELQTYCVTSSKYNV